jgi:hypothetical protein
MAKGFVLYSVQRMSRQDRRAFDRWLKANVVVGLILAAGLVAMALVGASSTPPGEATAANSKPSHHVPVMASK